MPSLRLTYREAMAAGEDAGNRSQRRAGRRRWNEDDWNVAAETVAWILGTSTEPLPPARTIRYIHIKRQQTAKQEQQ